MKDANTVMINFEHMPIKLVEEIYYKAIAVAWAYDNGDVEPNNIGTNAKLVELSTCVSKTSQYGVRA